MGLTQHHNAVATISEIVNLALAQGNIGKPGAGCCRSAATPMSRRPHDGYL
jgi:anaerobic selenocysteine-containing dehydrogenase